MHRHQVALLLSIALATSACGGDGAGGATSTTSSAARAIQVMATWIDDDEAAFRRVLDAFTRETGIQVEYQGAGHDLATVLSSRVDRGDPPDVAIISQPGLLRDLFSRGVLVPIEDAAGAAVDENFAPVWRDLGSVQGALYGVFFKASNKSTVWYNVGIFEANGLEPPETWDDWVDLSVQLRGLGITPIAVGGADGWVLSDWFENVYLRTAGPERYDQLA
ncbi:MAG: ABC transporter substrate-binding protein, partial [Acidimicrobiia bacterium]